MSTITTRKAVEPYTEQEFAAAVRAAHTFGVCRTTLEATVRRLLQAGYRV